MVCLPPLATQYTTRHHTQPTPCPTHTTPNQHHAVRPAPQEMMREFLERERRKQAEREAGKAEKAAAAEATPQTA